ncbi:MAG: hypothetical protein AAFZ09_12430 [Pseudomonadota bacterium]
MTCYQGQSSGTDPYDILPADDDRFLFDSRTSNGRDFVLAFADGMLAGRQRGEACSAYLFRDPLAGAE